MEQTTVKLPRATREALKKYNEFSDFLKAHPTTPGMPEKEELAIMEVMSDQYRLGEEYDWNSEFFEENGKVGLKNCFGEVEIPAIYDEIQPGFYRYQEPEVWAVAKKDGKYHKVARDGKGTILFTSDFAYMCRVPYTNLVAVKQQEQDKLYALALDNKLLTPFEIEIFGDVLYHCVRLITEDKVGLYDMGHGVYVKPAYEDISSIDPEEPFVFIKNGVEGNLTFKQNFISLYDMGNDDDKSADACEEGLIGFCPDF
jgi:hypothetical protein